MNDLDWEGDTSSTAAGTSKTRVRDNFVGDGVETEFTLSETKNAEPEEIQLNGIGLTPSLTTGFSYTLVGAALTLKLDNATYTPTAEDRITALYFKDN